MQIRAAHPSSAAIHQARAILSPANDDNGIKVNISQADIEGNKIGTNALGTAGIGNAKNGIYLFDSGYNSTIGGTISSAGNLISGNGDNGIKIEGSQCDHTFIKGNRIGVANDSLSGIPNTNSGISIASKGTFVGEAGAQAAQNIIAGNFGDGIRLVGSDAHNNVIENNFIGTNLNGAILTNFANGITISGGAHDNRIGGSNSNAANTIVNSSSDGVNISGNTTVNNAIQNNLIYANGDLGIDLGTNGVTPNDAGDADTGANNLQNFPVIQTAFTNRIIGTLNSQPNKTYTIELYRNNACDASGSGEGQFYLNSQTVMTDGGGNAAIDAIVALNAGEIVSATATDASGNTSEFAQCYVATAAPGALSFSSATYTAGEGAGTATINVTRTFGSTGAISVHYATSNGTATAGQDYTAASGTLNWASGDTTSKTFTVPITNDSSYEPNETVNLTLSNPTNGAGILTSPAVLTITDDDSAPTISVTDVSKSEGNQGATSFVFNVTLSTASYQTIALDYQTANGTATAGIDYTATSGTLNFAAGETTKQISVTVNGDTLSELDETFSINLSAPSNATILDGQGVGTILDDDNAGKLQFAASGGNVSEGAGTVTISVNRTNGTAGTVSVDYATSNGTATAGQDYTAAFGTLVLLDGQNKASFNVPLLQDATGEADETVFLTLSNPNGGATLGNPSSRTLTITDNDGGLPSNVVIGGNIVKNNQPLPNVLVTLSGSQSKTALTDASGNYNFTNLSSGGNYLVTPTLNGHSFEPFNLSYNNLSANVTNANFVGTTGTPSRILRVVNGDTVSGSSVVVPIELVSQGNENSVGFSLNYDANLLSNAQVSLGTDAAAGSLVVNSQTGKIGVLVALPAGQTFAAGTRQVAAITFLTAQTALFSTPVTFGDTPIVRETTDASAGVLPTAYADGLVMFAQGYEADVAPRPTGSGNGTVTVADFTQIGKFVAGIDTVDAKYNEFQRADSAPKGTKGNGFMTVSDYTQAGRYAAGLDPIQTAGGSSQASFAALEYVMSKAAKNGKAVDGVLGAARAVHVVNATTSPGQQVLVSILVDAYGDENGFGFSLNYDQMKLGNPLVSLGTGTVGATLIPNTLQAGKIGVVIAFPTGQKIVGGSKQLVTIRFDVAANAGGVTPLTFGDTPVFREVVNTNADVLSTVFVNGNITILGPTAATITIGGQVATSHQQGLANVRVNLTDAQGQTFTTVTDASGYYSFADVTAGESYVLTVMSKRFGFVNSSLFATATEDRSDINFVANSDLKRLRL